jgi:hypothetical protein
MDAGYIFLKVFILITMCEINEDTLRVT